MQGRITISAVEKLRPGDILHHSELVGFLVRRQQDATVYSVRRRFRGQNLLVTIGRHGAFTPHTARKEAARLLSAMAGGQDPRATQRSVVAFKDAAEEFLLHIRAKRSAGTAREYEGHLRGYLLPRFGRRALELITTDELDKLHMALQERPTLANRIMATASSLYGWAADKGKCADSFNPARRVERYKEEAKERFLTDDELKRLGKALREIEAEAQWSPFALAAIRLMLFTGCRRNEIRLAQWPDIDWQRGLLHARNAKGGRRFVHLNAGALAVLEALRTFPDDGNPHVIRGLKEGAPYANLGDAWEVVRKRAALKDVRLHDLRHSHASLAGADGASLPIIGALLGHRTAAASKRYTHVADNPAKLASERVGERVTRGLGE